MDIHKEIFPQNSPVCISVLWLSFLNIVPPVFHTDYSITDRQYVTLATDTLAKQHQLQSLEELSRAAVRPISKISKSDFQFRESVCVCMCVYLSVRPSVRMGQLSSHSKFDILSIFRKSVEKIQVSLKPVKNEG